jgi:hypothetical protein
MQDKGDAWGEHTLGVIFCMYCTRPSFVPMFLLVTKRETSERWTLQMPSVENFDLLEIAVSGNMWQLLVFCFNLDFRETF